MNGFLRFLGTIEMEHWAKMGQLKFSEHQTTKFTASFYITEHLTLTDISSSGLLQFVFLARRPANLGK